VVGGRDSPIPRRRALRSRPVPHHLRTMRTRARRAGSGRRDRRPGDDTLNGVNEIVPKNQIMRIAYTPYVGDLIHPTVITDAFRATATNDTPSELQRAMELSTRFQPRHINNEEDDYARRFPFRVQPYESSITAALVPVPILDAARQAPNGVLHIWTGSHNDAHFAQWVFPVVTGVAVTYPHYSTHQLPGGELEAELLSAHQPLNLPYLGEIPEGDRPRIMGEGERMIVQK